MLEVGQRARLAAYFSGDAASTERVAIEHWLGRDPLARRYLDALAADSRRLQTIPMATLDVADAVLARWALARPTPVADKPVTWERYVPASLVAVALMLGMWIGMGTPRPASRPTVSQPELAVATKPTAQPARVEHIPPADVDEPSTEERPIIVSVPTRPKKPDILTAPAPSMPQPVEVVPARLSLPMPARDLDRVEGRSRLVAELRGDAHRIELFCRDLGKSLDRLQQAAERHHVRLWIDPVLTEAHRRKMKPRFGVFTDEFTRSELTGWLADYAGKEKQRDGFEHLVLTPLNGQDRLELAVHLGADPIAARRKPLTTDPRTPLTADTLQQLQGVQPGSAGKPGERWAVVFAYLPQRSSMPQSREVRQYMESRMDRPRSEVSTVLIASAMPE